MGWIIVNISIGVLVGIFIGWMLFYKTSDDDVDGKVKKEIFDKLTSIKEDLENTV